MRSGDTSSARTSDGSGGLAGTDLYGGLKLGLRLPLGLCCAGGDIGEIAIELIARRDVPAAAVINEYLDVAHAFYDKRESGFVNGLLDAIARESR